MNLYSIKPRFQQALRAVERPLVRRRVHPDVLTLSALGISILGGVALAASRWQPGLLLVIPVIVLLRLALNALDGMVAKDLGVARPWGEVLNEFSDRLSDVALFGGLAFVPKVELPVATAAIALMLLSSYAGILSKAAGGPRQYGGVMGKADRMLLLAAASVVAFIVGPWVMDYALMVMAAGLLATLALRLGKTHADLKGLRLR
ncbi:MAG: CDP-alcohol phosphatidyltransferase family protein [Chloroflexi bacterium]|nr:CDP-alcohol phosphatidyltransferase family protein [Chloroflexota bacterium]